MSTLASGTVAFTAPSIVSFSGSGALGNGFVASQLIQTGAPSTSCSALQNINGLTQGNCNTLPGGLGLVLSVGDIVQVNGGNSTSNASFSSITNQFNSTFTADTSGVPEPSTFALLGLGLAALKLRRRDR